jgi:hypothetical protein
MKVTLSGISGIIQDQVDHGSNKKSAIKALLNYNIVLQLNCLCFQSHLLVNQNTAAMLANDDLFALADIRLALWRDLVKAS